MDIPYRLIRSDRRTLSLTIDGEGALVVRAPKRLPLCEVEAFIRAKAGWIAKKQAQARAYRREPFVPVDGALLPWQGATLRLRLCNVPMCIDYHGVLLTPCVGDAMAHVRAWRRERAEQALCPLIARWADAMGLRPRQVAFTNAKKRWGSMSTRGVLRLNSALMHVPPPLAEYVVVHALALLRRPAHSPACNALVPQALPDADERRAALRGRSSMTTLLAPQKEET